MLKQLDLLLLSAIKRIRFIVLTSGESLEITKRDSVTIKISDEQMLITVTKSAPLTDISEKTTYRFPILSVKEIQYHEEETMFDKLEKTENNTVNVNRKTNTVTITGGAKEAENVMINAYKRAKKGKL